MGLAVHALERRITCAFGVGSRAHSRCARRRSRDQSGLRGAALGDARLARLRHRAASLRLWTWDERLARHRGRLPPARRLESCDQVGDAPRLDRAHRDWDGCRGRRRKITEVIRDREALVAALRERGVDWLAPSDAQGPSLTDEVLIASLAMSEDARLRQALIGLFLLRPTLASLV